LDKDEDILNVAHREEVEEQIRQARDACKDNIENARAVEMRETDNEEKDRAFKVVESEWLALIKLSSFYNNAEKSRKIIDELDAKATEMNRFIMFCFNLVTWILGFLVFILPLLYVVTPFQDMKADALGLRLSGRDALVRLMGCQDGCEDRLFIDLQ